MKKIIVIFIFMGLINLTIGQNLVQNPSFETMSSCPFDQDQLSFATGWSSYGLTPDYFNACCTPGTVSVPLNWSGYQLASDGNGYAGFFAKFGAFHMEYIGSPLSQTLIPGTRYYISFKASLGIGNSCCAVNKIGVLCSTVPYSASNPAPFNNNPHIYTPYIVSDTANWTLISGSFIADSAYQYIIIGSFFQPDNIDSLVLDNISSYWPSGDSTCVSYYFVDEICVTPDSLGCELNIGIDESSFLTNVKVFPNPVSQNATLEFKNPHNECRTLKIFNHQGQLMRTISNIYSNNIDIIRNNLPSGLYYLQLWTDRQIIGTGRLIFE